MDVRKSFRALWSELGWQFFWGKAIPWLLPLLTLALGWVEKLPLAYVVAAVALAFGGGASGLLRASEWMQRQTPEHKVGITSYAVALDYVRDADGKVTGFKNGQFLFTLQNMAPFPISVVVDELITIIDDKTPPAGGPKLNDFFIPPLFSTTVRDNPVDLSSMPVRDRLQARLRLKARYGRKGDEQFPLNKEVTLFCAFNKQLGLYSDQVPQDTPGS